jgi:hypothetical protein
MILQLMDMSLCSYPDMSVGYAFQLVETRATLTRRGDSMVFSGNYNPETGEFRVSATHSIGTEEINGKLTLIDQWLELSGKHLLFYLDGHCTGQWSVSGRILAKTGR